MKEWLENSSKCCLILNLTLPHIPIIVYSVQNLLNYKLTILPNVEKRTDNSYIHIIQNKKTADNESNILKYTSNPDTRNDSAVSVTSKVVQPTYTQIAKKDTIMR